MKTTFLQVENFLSSQQHKERKEDILSKKHSVYSYCHTCRNKNHEETIFVNILKALRNILEKNSTR